MNGFETRSFPWTIMLNHARPVYSLFLTCCLLSEMCFPTTLSSTVTQSTSSHFKYRCLCHSRNRVRVNVLLFSISISEKRRLSYIRKARMLLSHIAYTFSTCNICKLFASRAVPLRKPLMLPFKISDSVRFRVIKHPLSSSKGFQSWLFTFFWNWVPPGVHIVPSNLFFPFQSRSWEQLPTVLWSILWLTREIALLKTNFKCTPHVATHRSHICRYGCLPWCEENWQGAKLDRQLHKLA